ncbi:MAG: radical SAM protein [Acidobacteriota bacterium]
MLWKLKQRLQQWLAEEKGTIIKDWGGKMRVALAFPNRYAIGMSNLGFQSVYGALNGLDDVVCERVFYPEPEDLTTIRQNPGRLLSIETQRPVRDFDLLAFSIPFENDYTNVVEMLAMAGLPHRSEDRRPGHPLVAAGGVAVFLNPEPLSPFVDFCFIGEAETLIRDFKVFRGTIEDSRMDRLELLRELAGAVPGIYVPELYAPSYNPDGTLKSFEPLGSAPERVLYRRADFTESVPCRSVILTPNTEFSNVELLEIGRGCGRGCRFCAAGFVYRPLRYHSAERLAEAGGKRMNETARLGLVSAAVSDHPEISHLCDTFLQSGAALSFSSLRADSLSPELAAALESSRHQSVAIAPEAGSERMRRVINKNIDMDHIRKAVDNLTERGILHLKLYFMIGLPTEGSEDLEAIVDVAKEVKHHVLKISRGRKQLGTITLSVNSFVPKSFTPFQWVPFAGVRELKDRAKWIQNALRKVPNVRVHFDLPKWAYIQALLARGDRRTAQFIEKVALEGQSWSQAMRNAPHNPDFWVMRERGKDELFPWEIVDLGLKRSYLWEEYQRALRAESSPPCRFDQNCRRCGVCVV